MLFPNECFLQDPVDTISKTIRVWTCDTNHLTRKFYYLTIWSTTSKLIASERKILLLIMRLLLLMRLEIQLTACHLLEIANSLYVFNLYTSLVLTGFLNEPPSI